MKKNSLGEGILEAEEATCLSHPGGPVIRVGDLVTAYKKGFHRVVKIERRFESDNPLYRHRDAKPGAE